MSDNNYLFDDDIFEIEELTELDSLEDFDKLSHHTPKPKKKPFIPEPPKRNSLGLTEEETQTALVFSIISLVMVIIFGGLMVYTHWYINQP